MISVRTTFAFFAACIGASSAGLRAEIFRLPISARIEASATWAENISRSAFPVNWIDTMRDETRFTVTMLTPIATGLSVISELDASYEDVPRFTLNNAFNAGAHATVRYKFGLGPYTPVISVNGGLTRREARIHADDSWIATGALTLSQRFTPSWRAAATGDWAQHYASHSTFDVRYHRFLGSVTYDLNSTWQLTYGKGRLWGDVVANASNAIYSTALAGGFGPRVQQYYSAIAFETTNSYNPGWIAYRVNARSDFWWLELDPAIGRNTSLPLRYESSYTVNLVGVPYRQDLWTVSILHRF